MDLINNEQKNSLETGVSLDKSQFKLTEKFEIIGFNFSIRYKQMIAAS